MNHRCITGIIAETFRLTQGDPDDEAMFREHGGLRFNYCPICGSRNSTPKRVVEVDCGDEVVLRVGNKFFKKQDGDNG